MKFWVITSNAIPSFCLRNSSPFCLSLISVELNTTSAFVSKNDVTIMERLLPSSLIYPRTGGLVKSSWIPSMELPIDPKMIAIITIGRIAEIVSSSRNSFLIILPNGLLIRPPARRLLQCYWHGIFPSVILVYLLQRFFLQQ